MSDSADERPASRHDTNVKIDGSYTTSGEIHAASNPFGAGVDEPAVFPAVPEAAASTTATLQPPSPPPPRASSTGASLQTPVGDGNYNLQAGRSTERPEYGSIAAARRKTHSGRFESSWQPQEASDCSKLMYRCCWFGLLIPFLFATGLMVFSVSTFAVMDDRVRENCISISCSLSCNNDSTSSIVDCGVVYAGGGLASFLGFITLFTIAVRICFGARM